MLLHEKAGQVDLFEIMCVPMYILIHSTESITFEDGQPVALEDGTMAFIHHTPKGSSQSLTPVFNK